MSGCVGVAGLLSREATTALLNEVTEALLLSREATTVLSRGVTDALSEEAGVVWPGIGLARVSGCVGVAGSLLCEATTALSREVTDAPLVSHEATTALSYRVIYAQLLWPGIG